MIFISSSSFAQNSLELLKLQHDGKLNLVPRYGFGRIEKTTEEKSSDTELINQAISEVGSKDSASTYYSQVGFSYFNKGDIRTAMKRFNQAWLLDSTNALSYFGFSSVLTVIGDNIDLYFNSKSLKVSSIENPEKYWKIGMQKDGNHKSEKFALYYISAGYETYGMINKAIESCNKLLSLNPIDTNILYQRGHLYTITKDWDKAIVDLTKAFPNGNTNSNALNDLGFAYDQSGDYKNAKICYDKSILITPDYLNPIYNNSVMHLRIGEYALALEYIDRCIEIKNDVGQFYKTKGEILIKQNIKKEAIKNLKKAKKLGDKDAEKILKEIS